MPDDLIETIVTKAQEPQSASDDVGSMTNRPLKDLIEADKYAKANAAVRTPGRLGVTFKKIVPPSAA